MGVHLVGFSTEARRAEYFTEQDHRTFGQTVREHLVDTPWIITYDNSDLVRKIYAGYTIREFDLYHSAHDRANGTELLITNLPEKCVAVVTGRRI